MTNPQMKMLMELLGIKNWTVELIEHKQNLICVRVDDMSYEKEKILEEFLQSFAPAPFKITVAPLKY